MKVITDTLGCASLDWAAAWSVITKGSPFATMAELSAIEADPAHRTFRPTEDWGAAGPLLDGLRIDVNWGSKRSSDGRVIHQCQAAIHVEHTFQNYTGSSIGFTTIANDERVAKLRCLVAMTLGPLIDVPDRVAQFDLDAQGPHLVARPLEAPLAAREHVAVVDDFGGVLSGAFERPRAG